MTLPRSAVPVVVLGLIGGVVACSNDPGPGGVPPRRFERTSTPALDGTVRSDGEVTTGRHVETGTQHAAGCGDLVTTEEVRVFFSFAIADLPAGAVILEAFLVFRQVSRRNMVLALNPLLIESVVYGPALDAGDFALPSTGAPTPVTLNGLDTVRTIDVTLLLQRDVDARRPTSQFRLRMQGGTNGNALSDFVTIETADNDYRTGDRPVLMIEWEPR